MILPPLSPSSTTIVETQTLRANGSTSTQIQTQKLPHIAPSVRDKRPLSQISSPPSTPLIVPPLDHGHQRKRQATPSKASPPQVGSLTIVVPSTIVRTVTDSGGQEPPPFAPASNPNRSPTSVGQQSLLTLASLQRQYSPPAKPSTLSLETELYSKPIPAGPARLDLRTSRFPTIESILGNPWD
jgi:hypothetical protein